MSVNDSIIGEASLFVGELLEQFFGFISSIFEPLFTMLFVFMVVFVIIYYFRFIKNTFKAFRKV